MVVPHWIVNYLWANLGVGNFTASGVMFAVGGRWAWKKHKAHMQAHHEELKAHLTREVERIHRGS